MKNIFRNISGILGPVENVHPKISPEEQKIAEKKLYKAGMALLIASGIAFYFASDVKDIPKQPVRSAPSPLI